MKSLYPGIALIGSEETAGIYGMNGGIIDAKGIGLQHLFYKSYQQDLIHSACTLIKIDDTLFYGNRVHSKYSHPVHIKSKETCTEDGYIFCDRFSIYNDNITKIDKVFAYGKSFICFETSIKNTSREEIEAEVYSYLIIRNSDLLKLSFKEKNILTIDSLSRVIGIKGNGQDLINCVEESPTGFPYRTTQSLLYNEEKSDKLQTKSMAGVLMGKKMVLKPGKEYLFKWAININESKDKLIDEFDKLEINECINKSKNYWDNWISQGKNLDNIKDEYRTCCRINMIASKAALLNGFIPADLTGHYYAEGSPSYYPRDSMMAARSFLLSGHIREFEDIMNYLISRPIKENYEFYQRYDGVGNPSEGANNHVFHQLDSIGYYARNIWEYYKITGKMLLSYERFKNYITVLLNNNSKNGLLGPEGGINEGVFGPAYITSSNMIIYGGIKAAINIAEIYNDKDFCINLKKLSDIIYKGIQTTLIKTENGDKWYCYGYVDYNQVLVKKYDTPQYFGVLYGYPNDEGMIGTNKIYLKYASFYQDGIGYSEQEYHHGPWIFNTAACAEYCAISGDLKEYTNKVNWLIHHSNAYGLMPEAIDADDESKCYINPLTWACAEFVSALFSPNYEKGMNKENDKI